MLQNYHAEFRGESKEFCSVRLFLLKKIYIKNTQQRLNISCFWRFFFNGKIIVCYKIYTFPAFSQGREATQKCRKSVILRYMIIFAFNAEQHLNQK